MKIAKTYTIPKRDMKAEQKSPSRNIISLVPEEPDEKITADRVATYSLRTVPDDANSAKYKVVVRIIHGDEDVRTIVQWYLDVQKVCTGLHARHWAERKPIVEALMGGTPKSQFQTRLHHLMRVRMDERIAAVPNDANQAANQHNIRQAGVEAQAN